LLALRRPTPSSVERAVTTFRRGVRDRLSRAYHGRGGIKQQEHVGDGERPSAHRLRRVALNRFTVTVVAGKSFAGHVAYIARWSTRSHRWVTVKRFVLAQSQSNATVSLATVKARIASKTEVRAFLSQTQVQPGYISGYSNFIRA
jgi:hypothetical protein